MQLRDRPSGFIRTEGGLLPADLLERVRAIDRKLPGLEEVSYGLAKNERFGDAIARSWNKLVGAWATFTVELPNVAPSDPATTTTRERFLLPLFDELGYGRLSPTKAIDIDGKSYPVSHSFADIVPLHLVGAHISIETRTKGVAGAAGQSPHGLVQEFLNRSPERLWGIVTNGRTLRILRDNASLVRQAYVEFDLEAIMAGEAYADFALLWHLAHRTRLEPRVADTADEGSTATQAGCYLERWSKVAEETGARARDRLRDGVEEAIEALGTGFLAHRANAALRAALEAGELTTQDYYRELLRLVYRLILLFVAEDRDLLLDPKAEPGIRDRYARFYSTARIRRLAERRKGTRHTDLYVGLRVVIGALGSDDGATGIGLPPLGGFLFGAEACPHLDAAELANSDLLDAIRKLATIEEKAVLRTVDYRNLGSEELGSIYESLLELSPEIDTKAAHFKLQGAAGNERKTTGSYYTPSSLISVLLDSALDPVLSEIADKPTKEEAERAILEMSVLDPAAGSGHFLVAAAHRIAKRLAQVRTEDEEPAPSAITTALRDVIGHCLYAVDINPMAVELCKVSLWLEALEPGKPLTFLDAHVKCGNSLLGTTPELIAHGIPDAAYDPIEGDDKAVAAALKKRNRAERDQGQLTLGEGGLDLPIAGLAAAVQGIELIGDSVATELRSKERLHDSLKSSTAYSRLKTLADAWTAAFVYPKFAGSGISTAMLRSLRTSSEAEPSILRNGILELATKYQMFHFHIEFPRVFSRGGFDVVVGNPPWERVKLQDKEFFATRAPEIAAIANAATRRRRVANLVHEDPALWSAYRDALRRAEGESHLLRNTGVYPLTGRGDINTYAVFAERMRSLVRRGRFVGCIVPTGIATDDSTSRFFADLATRDDLVALFDFENRRGIFPQVHRSYKFSVLVMSNVRREKAPMRLAFFLLDVSDLLDPNRMITLLSSDIALVNPNTKTSPIFRTRRDAELVLGIYRHMPALDSDDQAKSSGWGPIYSRMFDVTNDADEFKTFEESTGSGWELVGNHFVKGRERRLPLYEDWMIHQFDHRYQANGEPPASDVEKEDPSFVPLPRYWIDRRAAQEHWPDHWSQSWTIGIRNRARATDSRTLVASVIPLAGVGNPVPLLLPAGCPQLSGAFLAILNSFALDFVVRQKVGGMNMNLFYLRQFPIPTTAAVSEYWPWAHATGAKWMADRVLELVYTSSDLEAFAKSLGWDGPPFKWDPIRRRLIRAELDAAIFHLFGLGGSDVSYVLDTFSIVRERDHREHGSFRTKELIESIHAAISVATQKAPYVSALSPRPADRWFAHPGATGAPIGMTSTRGISDGASLGHAQDIGPVQGESDAAIPGTSGGAAGLDLQPGNGPEYAGRAGWDAEWLPENAVDPDDISPGQRVRHRRLGLGTVLGVRRVPMSDVVTIRFGASDQRDIAIGYGWLEFEI